MRADPLRRHQDTRPLLRARGRSDRCRRAPARRARDPPVDDLPRHHGRGAATHSRGRERPARRHRLPPLVFARARRSREHGVDAGEHAEDLWRRHGGVRGRNARGARGDDRRARPRHHRAVARGRGAREVGREHLPRGEHRLRERVGDARARDGHRHLGRARRRGDQAVRIPEFPARDRAGRPVHPGEPVLPLLARASTTSTRASSSSPATSTSAWRAT